MGTWEIGDIDNSDIGQTTPAKGAFTELKASTDPVDEHGVGDRGYNDIRYAEFGTPLDIVARADEDISIGEVVYGSGATGQKMDVSLADNTVDAKTKVVGVAAETKTTGQDINIRIGGQLDDIDTSGLVEGNCAYLSTAGAITTTEPVAGVIICIGLIEYSHAVSGKMIVNIRRSRNKGAPAATNLFTRLGDSVGTNKIEYRDYANTEVAAIDSNGNFTMDGTVDGRDLATDGTKLDGIEAAATKYPDTGEQAFLDADHTKLDGISAGADVTNPLEIINSIVCYLGEVIVHDGNIISN